MHKHTYILTLPPILVSILVALAGVTSAKAESNIRPALIVNGPDSVASQLHYPAKAKAAKRQAAIPFYCEVGADGKPDHLQLYGPNDASEFRTALLAALRHGRFQPAMVGGREVPVIVGGTAFFMFSGNQPVIAVTLTTADKTKTAALRNYVQPQMISSSAEFRRKLRNSQYDSDIHLRPGVHPSAIMVADVDAQGNVTGTKIQAESPADSGWGPLLLKALKSAKFTPALNNGKPVAGQFDLIVNYEYVFNPDADAATGTHLKRDDYDR